MTRICCNNAFFLSGGAFLLLISLVSVVAIPHELPHGDPVLISEIETDKTHEAFYAFFSGAQFFSRCNMTNCTTGHLLNMAFRWRVPSKESFTYIQNKPGELKGFRQHGEELFVVEYWIEAVGDNECTWFFPIVGYTITKETDTVIVNFLTGCDGSLDYRNVTCTKPPAPADYWCRSLLFQQKWCQHCSKPSEGFN